MKLTLQQNLMIQVLAMQAMSALALSVAVVIVTFLVSGAESVATLGMARAKATMFGGWLGILTTAMTARTVVKSIRAAKADPRFSLLPMYAGVAWKLLIVAGGAYFGFAYWQLGPAFMALGFIIIQAGYFWAAVDLKRP